LKSLFFVDSRFQVFNKGEIKVSTLERSRNSGNSELSLASGLCFDTYLACPGQDWTVRFKMGSLRLYENMFTAPTIWVFVFFSACVILRVWGGLHVSNNPPLA